jgi:hypothetical protein
MAPISTNWPNDPNYSLNIKILGIKGTAVEKNVPNFFLCSFPLALCMSVGCTDALRTPVNPQKNIQFRIVEDLFTIAAP